MELIIMSLLLHIGGHVGLCGFSPPPPLFLLSRLIFDFSGLKLAVFLLRLNCLIPLVNVLFQLCL